MRETLKTFKNIIRFLFIGFVLLYAVINILNPKEEKETWEYRGAGQERQDEAPNEFDDVW